MKKKSSIKEEIHQIVWQLSAAIWDASKDEDTESSIDYQKRAEKQLCKLCVLKKP